MRQWPILSLEPRFLAFDRVIPTLTFHIKYSKPKIVKVQDIGEKNSIRYK